MFYWYLFLFDSLLRQHDFAGIPNTQVLRFYTRYSHVEEEGDIELATFQLQVEDTVQKVKEKKLFKVFEVNLLSSLLNIV